MVDAIFDRQRTRPQVEFDLGRGVPLSGAAEQMFFFGTPLAHIVAYEAWQRNERLRQTYRRQARIARSARLELPPPANGDLA